MKRTTFTLLTAAAFLVASAAVAAEMQTSRSVGAHPVVFDDYPESDLVLEVGNGILLTVTGEARTRFEWVENASDFSTSGTSSSDDDVDFDDEYYFAPSRVNLGFRVDLPRDVAAVVELQSAFDWGEDGGLENRLAVNQYMRPSWSSSLAGARSARAGSSDEFTLYQGYIEAANIGDSLLSLRVGRQELAYGTEMLLGNRDFYDGASYDAVKAIFEFSDNSRLDLFYAKLNESNLSGAADGGEDNDVNGYGAYFSSQSLGGSSIGLDAYLLGVRDNSDNSIQAGGNKVPEAGSLSYAESYWAGVRVFREGPGWHFSAEAAYQFGQVSTLFGGVADEVDINAMAFEGFVGYTWDTPTHPGIHGNVTWAEGGVDSDGDISTFFTPNGEIHSRLGLMDLVDLSDLTAISLGYTGEIDNHSWGVDIWNFETDEDYAGEDEIGQEVDLWYNYQYSKNLVAQFAIAFFNAGDLIETSYAGTGVSTSDAWRVYSNLLLRF